MNAAITTAGPVVHSSWFLVLGSWFLVFGFWFLFFVVLFGPPLIILLMKKPVLFLNLSWVVIAAGTFYAGVVWREGRSVVSEVTAVGPRVPVTPGLPKMGAGEGLVKAGTVSRDDDVLDFFKRILTFIKRTLF